MDVVVTQQAPPLRTVLISTLNRSGCFRFTRGVNINEQIVSSIAPAGPRVLNCQKRFFLVNALSRRWPAGRDVEHQSLEETKSKTSTKSPAAFWPQSHSNKKKISDPLIFWGEIFTIFPQGAHSLPPKASFNDNEQT